MHLPRLKVNASIFSQQEKDGQPNKSYFRKRVLQHHTLRECAAALTKIVILKYPSFMHRKKLEGDTKNRVLLLLRYSQLTSAASS